tara:strand:+ start:1364 stop:2848 length:1485 start_codon:yes stop_codon:yes gene_type:complete
MEFKKEEYTNCILSEYLDIDSYDFYYENYQAKLRPALKKFLEIESPIEYELFIKKVRLSHGFEKAGGPIRKIIDSCLKGISKKTYFRDKVFLWNLDADPSEFKIARHPGGNGVSNKRTVNQVAPEEIVAIANILDSPVNYLKFKSGIAKKISEFLGFQKLTEVSKLYIYDAIENYSNFENLKNKIDEDKNNYTPEKDDEVVTQEMYEADMLEQAESLNRFIETSRELNKDFKANPSKYGVIVKPKIEKMETDWSDYSIEDLKIELAKLYQIHSEKYVKLQSISNELNNFQNEYIVKVGDLITYRDELIAQLEELITISSPENKENSDKAREEAKNSKKEYEQNKSDFEKKPKANITKEIRELYLEIVKLIHPDKTTDPKEKELRNEFMKIANEAYSNGDAEELNNLYEKIINGTINNDYLEEEKNKIINEINTLKIKITELDNGYNEAISSDLYQLYESSKKYDDKEDFFKAQRDLLSNEIDDLKKKIQNYGKS